MNPRSPRRTRKSIPATSTRMPIGRPRNMSSVSAASLGFSARFNAKASATECGNWGMRMPTAAIRRGSLREPGASGRGGKVLDSGFPIPVTIAVIGGAVRGEHGFQFGAGQLALERTMIRLDDPVHLSRLRAQAHDIDAELAHLRQRARQIIDLGRLSLEAVEREKRLTFARGERQSVRMIQAAVLAVIFGKVLMPCRVGPWREGKR